MTKSHTMHLKKKKKKYIYIYTHYASQGLYDNVQIFMLSLF